MRRGYPTRSIRRTVISVDLVGASVGVESCPRLSRCSAGADQRLLTLGSWATSLAVQHRADTHLTRIRDTVRGTPRLA
jgi:hypothetical protein